MRAILCGAFCLVVLVAMLVRHAWPLWTGETIHLQVRPVDPRDLFRGDYVILSYDISRIVVGSPGAAGDAIVPAEGDWWSALGSDVSESPSEVYVQLEPGADDGLQGPPVYRAVQVGGRPSPGHINLRGRVIDWQRQASGDVVLRLEYGLEAFYVQEGTGRPIEEALRSDRPVVAEVAVTASGRARVRDLVIGR